MYGLKQSPRAWFGKFTKVTKECGYKQNQGDHIPFIKYSESREFSVLVYGDDIIVIEDNEEEKLKLRKKIDERICNLRRLKYFFYIEIAYSTQSIFISQ